MRWLRYTIATQGGQMRSLLFIGFLTLLAAPSLRAQHAVASFEEWEASKVAGDGWTAISSGHASPRLPV